MTASGFMRSLFARARSSLARDIRALSIRRSERDWVRAEIRARGMLKFAQGTFLTSIERAFELLEANLDIYSQYGLSRSIHGPQRLQTLRTSFDVAVKAFELKLDAPQEGAKRRSVLPTPRRTALDPASYIFELNQLNVAQYQLKCATIELFTQALQDLKKFEPVLPPLLARQQIRLVRHGFVTRTKPGLDPASSAGKKIKEGCDSYFKGLVDLRRSPGHFEDQAASGLSVDVSNVQKKRSRGQQRQLRL